MDVQVIALSDAHREIVDATIRDAWSGPLIVSRGRIIDTSANPGFVVVDDTERVRAFVTYEIRNDEAEITTLYSMDRRRGYATALLESVAALAREQGLRRVWLITTNDNSGAIGFYERRGFDRVAVHVGAVDRSRELKPSIPLLGTDGIPIRDECEFQIILEPLGSA